MENVLVPYFKRYYEAPLESTYLETTPEFEVDKTRVPKPDIISAMANQLHTPSLRERVGERLTPDYVTSLKPNEIFVFGSNLAGIHGGGAARTARLYFGAKMGVGVGPQGQSYAIPTMQGGTDTIQPYVDDFIKYARQHPDQTFLVTPIGCGIAGFYADDIAPLFRDAVDVENIHLPEEFWDILLS